MRALSPTPGSQPKGPALGGGPQSILLWKPEGLDCRLRETKGTMGKRLNSWRAQIRSYTHRNPGQKHWFHRSLGQTYLLVLEGLLGRWQVGGIVVLTGFFSWWRTQWQSMWTPAGGRRLGSLTPRPGPTQQHGGSSAGTPQANQPTARNTAPTISRRAYWDPRNFWTCLWTWPCPLEGQDPAPQTSGQAWAPPARKTEQASNQPHTPGGRHLKQEKYDPAKLSP